MPAAPAMLTLEHGATTEETMMTRKTFKLSATVSSENLDGLRAPIVRFLGPNAKIERNSSSSAPPRSSTSASIDATLPFGPLTSSPP